MKRIAILSLCFSVAILASSGVTAYGSAYQQQPNERTTQEPAQAPVSKKKQTEPKSTTAKVAASSQKAKNRPGKRFWSRIMNVFRDVHSAEKKPK